MGSRENRPNHFDASISSNTKTLRSDSLALALAFRHARNTQRQGSFHPAGGGLWRTASRQPVEGTPFLSVVRELLLLQARWGPLGPPEGG